MNQPIMIAAIALLTCGAAAAQDLTGRWTGVAESTDEAGTKRQEKQTLEIKSEDGKLTGMMVSRSGKGGTPLQVHQDGGKVNLYGFITLDGGEHFRWKLELTNGNLVGTFSAQHNSPKKWIYDRIGTMTVTKAEVPASSPASK